LTVLHDCNKKFALKHKKEKLSNASLGMLDPATVISLFRRMTDEVHIFFFIVQDYYMQQVLLVWDIGLFNVYSSSLLVLKNTTTVMKAGE
jgi:hypothetical protein